MYRALVLVALTGIAHADELATLSANAPTCERATCIGLRLHVPVEDNRPLATPAWTAAQLAAANRHFAPLGVGFQLVGIAPLPASAARVEDRDERTAFSARMSGKVVDVFITGHLDDVDTPGAMARGVTWHTKRGKLIIVSTQGVDLVLAHELGHLFGLPHSTYPISIMNKTPRDEPPREERTFHADELVKLKSRIRALVRSGAYVNLAGT